MTGVLWLDESGLLSEGSGQNLFLVRDNVVYTPSVTSSILQGITRDTVLDGMCIDGLFGFDNGPRFAAFTIDGGAPVFRNSFIAPAFSLLNGWHQVPQS